MPTDNGKRILTAYLQQLNIKLLISYLYNIFLYYIIYKISIYKRKLFIKYKIAFTLTREPVSYTHLVFRHPQIN